MKLQKLLKQITPLPWRKLQTQTKANAAYALHAANMLAQLLAAAKNLQDNWEHNLTEPMARLNEAVEIAQDINTTLRTEPRKRG